MSIKKIGDINFQPGKKSIGLSWRAIVGDLMSRNSSPISVDNGVLKIAVLSPTWTHHMRAFRHKIVQNVFKHTGIKVNRVQIFNSSKSKSSFKEIKFYNEKDEKSLDLKEIEAKRVSLNIFNSIEDVNLKSKLNNIAAISLVRTKTYNS